MDEPVLEHIPETLTLTRTRILRQGFMHEDGSTDKDSESSEGEFRGISLDIDSGAPPPGTPGPPRPPAPHGANAVAAVRKDPAQMTMPEIKDELRKMSSTTSGDKSSLVERLTALWEHHHGGA